MSEQRPRSREHRHEIEIDAPPDVVWRAITHADELTRWYVTEASVTPGEGGTFRLAWGAADAGELRVEAWEPGRRLRLVIPPQEGGVDLDFQQPIAEEWLLEGRGGKTMLRMVQSDLPATPGWDDFYDATNHGFDMFLTMLRHYLERHPGEPRRTALVERQLTAPPSESWAGITAVLGLDGDGWAVQLPTGQRLSGTVLLDHHERVLVATVDQLDDGLLAIALEMRTCLWVNLSAFGAAAARLEALEDGWRTWLAAAAPPASEPATSS